MARAVQSRVEMVDARIDGHEDICALRYQSIEKAMEDMKKAMSAMQASVVAMEGSVDAKTGALWDRLWKATGLLVAILLALVGYLGARALGWA